MSTTVAADRSSRPNLDEAASAIDALIEKAQQGVELNIRCLADAVKALDALVVIRAALPPAGDHLAERAARLRDLCAELGWPLEPLVDRSRRSGASK